MFFVHLLTAVLVAFLFSALFVSMLGWRRNEESSTAAAFLFFFFILLLASWAGGMWIGPFGPTLIGVPYLPFLLVGLITALILVAALPPRRPARGAVAPGPDERRGDEAAATALGGAFWILLILLLIAAIAGYR